MFQWFKYTRPLSLIPIPVNLLSGIFITYESKRVVVSPGSRNLGKTTLMISGCFSIRFHSNE